MWIRSGKGPWNFCCMITLFKSSLWIEPLTLDLYFQSGAIWPLSHGDPAAKWSCFVSKHLKLLSIFDTFETIPAFLWYVKTIRGMKKKFYFMYWASMKKRETMQANFHSWHFKKISPSHLHCIKLSFLIVIVLHLSSEYFWVQTITKK